MELPVGYAARVPVDEALDVQRDGPRGDILGDRDVVTIRDGGSAVASGQPISVEFDMNVPAGRPHRADVSYVVAVR